MLPMIVFAPSGIVPEKVQSVNAMLFDVKSSKPTLPTIPPILFLDEESEIVPDDSALDMVA